MSSIAKATIRIVIATIILGCMPISLRAAIVSVANNGMDNPTCGGESDPCRSITQAIANAGVGDTIQVGPGYYGDINYNGILGDSGEEVVLKGCNCMILLDKQVRLESIEGAEYTILDAKGLVDSVVTIYADGVVFGGTNKGFTLMNANWAGIINTASQGVAISGNQAIGNQAVGFFVGGNNHKFTQNAAIANGQGFFISGSGHELIHNVAIGNSDAGFRISATSVEMSYNSGIGNKVAGIFLDFGDTKVERNNIYGNEAGFSNCGIRNFSNGTVLATNNYWGMPTGPGFDPADDVCNFGSSSAITVPFAVQEWQMQEDSCSGCLRRIIRQRRFTRSSEVQILQKLYKNTEAETINGYPANRGEFR